MMNKKLKQRLNETLDKALAPPKKRTHLDELLDEYDDKTSVSPSRPTPPHPTSPHLTSPQSTPPSSMQPQMGEPKTAETDQQKRSEMPVAPTRDFNRRANSLDRDALPAGLFPGVSKKLYDALYLRTRGAVQPTRYIRATKRNLTQWSGIGSQNTLDAHLRHFIKAGLLIQTFEVGDNSGATYEVLIPEEIGATPPHPTPPHPTSPHLTSPHLTSHQKLGGGSPQKMGWGGVGHVIEKLDTSVTANTSFNTCDDDDGVNDFAEALRQAGREILGGDLPKSEIERERWRESAAVLVEELKQAAERAGNISSVPAFLATHLRRRFKKGTSAKEDKHSVPETSRAKGLALSKEQKILRMIKQLQTLHVGDSSYQEADMIDDLKYRCSRDGITWDDELIDKLLHPENSQENGQKISDDQLQ
jgi:hypothetical protein